MPASSRKLPAPLYELKKRFTGPSPVTAPSTEAELAAQTDQELEAAWAEYMIPGHPDVLRNKLGRSWAEPFGIADKKLLGTTEEQITAIREVDPQVQPIEGDFSLRHMKAIHAHLFGDVYEWAGEHRTVDMTKDGHDYMAHFQIERLWGKVSDYVERNNRFQDLQEPAEFVDKLAFVWGRVNVIHAFREGNTRSQTVFFDQLCKQAGFELDVSRMKYDHPESIRDEFVEARFHHQDNDYDHAPLAAVLSKIVRPVSVEPSLEQRLELAATPSPDQAQWAPEARHRAAPLPVHAASDYDDPDKMRTAHRRPTIQEDTMATDPSKTPGETNYDPLEAMRKHNAAHDALDRVMGAYERTGVMLPDSPALGRKGNAIENLVITDREAREKAAKRVPRPPHAPVPPRPGSMRASLSRTLPSPPAVAPTPSVSSSPAEPPALQGAPGDPVPFSDEWWAGSDAEKTPAVEEKAPKTKSAKELAEQKLKYAHLSPNFGDEKPATDFTGPEF